MELNNLDSLRLFSPELFLSATIIVVLLMAAFQRSQRNIGVRVVTALGLAIATAGVWCMMCEGTQGLLFFGNLALDPFALFIKMVALLTAGLALVLSMTSRSIHLTDEPEYYSLLLTLTLGLLTLASANNLLMIYLALEISSLMSYLLTGFLRRDKQGVEAAMKYMLYGAVASGAMLYGFSLIYGLTGTLNLAEVSQALQSGAVPSFTLLTAILLCLAGFAYKISTVPFHMWTPDVYEGAPLPIVAFFSIAPKAAGLAVMARFFYVGFGQSVGDEWQLIIKTDWTLIVAVLSVLTMTLGNLAALSQSNLKRLFAYSTIAHAGYMLMGIVLLSSKGLAAVLFYLVVYMLMNMGAFLVVMMVADERGSDHIDNFRGLGWKRPLVAVCMAIFLFSLTGLPFFAGFMGKLFLFAEVMNQGVYWLAVIAALNSAVSLFYYARIAKAMFLEQPEEGSEAIQFKLVHQVLAVLLAIPTATLIIYWGPLYELALRSAKLLG